MKSLLILMVIFTSVTAILGGLLLVGNPDGSLVGMPTDLLAGSMFTDYVFPGVILITTAGLFNAIAAIFLLLDKPKQMHWTIAAGVMITGWIVVQMLMLQTLLWIQLLYLGIGVSTILLSMQLRRTD